MRFCIRRLHASRRHARSRTDRAFTLVEILVAMVVTLIMLGIVVTIFGMIGKSVSESRSTMEMTDRLRATKQRLQLDLAGITVPMLPPQNPDGGLGYFEYIEGPVGRLQAFTLSVLDETGLAANSGPDTTVGDLDDIIMFTTQSVSEPFVGRHQGLTVTSQVAEVVWFVRGTTLYRRQLLVKPDFNRTGVMPTPTQLYMTPHLYDSNLGQSYYATSDVSAHADGKGVAGDANLGPLAAAADPLRLVANSLSDLTKRENRYAHIPVMGKAANQPLYGWPFDARKYGWFVNTVTGQVSTGRLGLATLQESSDLLCPLPIGIANNAAGTPVTDSRFYPSTQLQLTTPSSNEEFDAWDKPNAWAQVDIATGQLNSFPNGSRVGEDVIMTNVLSFDVKVWDPTAPILLDADGATYLLPGDPGPGYGLTTSAYGISLAAAVGAPATKIVGRGAYVDLNYANEVLTVAQQTGLGLSVLAGHPDPKSGLNGPISFVDGGGTTHTVTANLVPAVYDTWSTHYERDGIDQNQNGIADEGTNGIDDNVGVLVSNGLIDDAMEQETAPPYPTPIRGIQIKIRCFDPDSKQIREVTIVQEFLPE